MATARLDVLKTYKLFINGAFPRTESGRSIEVKDAKGKVIAHLCRGSRKDVRDAVEAATAAQPKWAGATAYNRGQVLYRMAEMMEGKRDELAAALMETSTSPKVEKSKGKGKRQSVQAKPMGAAEARREVEASIDRLVCFAGWADKYAQVLGCQNAVAGPYYNFTTPEATGVVGVVTPPLPHSPALLGMISLLAPPLCAGNAVVVIADDHAMLPGAVFGEVCATSDVPAGIINIITGERTELLKPLAEHRGVNAISAANLSKDEAMTLKLGIADNLKRVRIAKIAADDWFEATVCEGPWTIEPFVEFKTVWHPSAV